MKWDQGGCPACQYCGAVISKIRPQAKNQRFCPGGRCRGRYWTEYYAAGRERVKEKGE